jgi:hypothetical protein
MRERSTTAILCPLRLPKRVRVTLELQRSGATISGQLSVERTAAIEFFGWLQLIDELERAAGPLEMPSPAEPTLGNALHPSKGS